MNESERKQFLLLQGRVLTLEHKVDEEINRIIRNLQGRVLALEDRLERFEKFWGWKNPALRQCMSGQVISYHFTPLSDEDIKAYIFDGVKEAK